MFPADKNLMQINTKPMLLKLLPDILIILEQIHGLEIITAELILSGRPGVFPPILQMRKWTRKDQTPLSKKEKGIPASFPGPALRVCLTV